MREVERFLTGVSKKVATNLNLEKITTIVGEKLGEIVNGGRVNAITLTVTAVFSIGEKIFSIANVNREIEMLEKQLSHLKEIYAEKKRAIEEELKEFEITLESQVNAITQELEWEREKLEKFNELLKAVKANLTLYHQLAQRDPSLLREVVELEKFFVELLTR